MSPSPSAQEPNVISVLPQAHVETESRKRDGLGTVQESPGKGKRLQNESFELQVQVYN